MVRELLEQVVETFNLKSRNDEKFRRELEGLRRTVQLEFDDGSAYHFNLKDTLIDGVHDGKKEGAEILVFTDVDTFSSIILGEMSPMRAYATKKIKFKASLSDMLMMRKFFG